MTKLIIILGIVGSGKTTLAKKLTKYGYKQIGIDDFYPKGKRDKEWFKDKEIIARAYNKMFRAIKSELKKGDVVIDTTGVPVESREMIKKLEKISKVRTIKYLLKVPLGLAKERVRQRNIAKEMDHTPLKFVEYVYNKMKKINLKPYFVIDGKKEINEKIKEIIKNRKIKN